MDYLPVYITLGILVIATAVVIIQLIQKKKSTTKNDVEMTDILSLIDKNNVIKIEYIRNKIVISFIDITKFDVEKLHSYGIEGINIVGDKIKFYINGSNEENEKVFIAIKTYIEG